MQEYIFVSAGLSLVLSHHCVCLGEKMGPVFSTWPLRSQYPHTPSLDARGMRLYNL